jgi:hypothetical protein
MFRHNHRLEILLGDLECRYGKDHPISLDIRAALPKVSESFSAGSKSISSRQKPDVVGRSKKITGALS